MSKILPPAHPFDASYLRDVENGDKLKELWKRWERRKIKTEKRRKEKKIIKKSKDKAS